VAADAEMLEIDAMEDALSPVDEGTEQVRELISSIELCHHKAERWIHNIIESIGAGGSDKGLGTRSPGPLHEAEEIWAAASRVLSNWCMGRGPDPADGAIGDLPAAALTERLGARSPLKVWQVERVISKIDSLMYFPPPTSDPSAGFTWLLLYDDDGEPAYRKECPDPYADHEEFWRATAKTIIRDTHEGRDAPLSLALAVDMLWPCHWDFTANLEIVIAAIGGDLETGRPFAACGRNIGRLPGRDRYESLCRSLRAFVLGSTLEVDTDPEVVASLGPPTLEKRWLAASLEKTIRLQLDPHDALRDLFLLPGPSWIHDGEATGGKGGAET
jgi:hypothetical protein